MGASRGGSQFAIFFFKAYALHVLFWEKIPWIPKCNINIGDLCDSVSGLYKDGLLISKLFHTQQVVCPVWLIQSGVNSRWINSLASGFLRLQKCQEKPQHPHYLPFLRFLLSHEWLILWLQQCLKLTVWYHRMPDPDQGANVSPCQSTQLGFKLPNKNSLREGHCADLMPRTVEKNYSILNLKVRTAAF